MRASLGLTWQVWDTLGQTHKMMQTQEALREKDKEKSSHYLWNLSEWKNNTAMNRNPGVRGRTDRGGENEFAISRGHMREAQH